MSLYAVLSSSGLTCEIRNNQKSETTIVQVRSGIDLPEKISIDAAIPVKSELLCDGAA